MWNHYGIYPWNHWEQMKESEETMANVNSSVEVTLTKEEKELLEKAIAKIEDIYEDVVEANSSLFIDETEIFSILRSTSRRYDGKLPSVIEIEE